MNTDLRNQGAPSFKHKLGGICLLCFNFMLSLPQDETEQILEDSLLQQGVKVERGIGLNNLEQRDGRVTAQLKRQDSLSSYNADFVLGADGAHSSVRKSLGLDPAANMRTRGALPMCVCSGRSDMARGIDNAQRQQSSFCFVEKTKPFYPMNQTAF